MRFKIIIITLIAILTFSCELKEVYDDTLTGDGNIVESSIPIKLFRDIKLFSYSNFGTGDKRTRINIIKSNENRIEIRTDKNVLDNMELINEDYYFSLDFIHDYDNYDLSILEITIYVQTIEEITNGIGYSDVHISGFNEVNTFKYVCKMNSNIYFPETFTANEGFNLYIYDDYRYEVNDFNLYGLKNLISNNNISIRTNNGSYQYEKTSSKINYPSLKYIKCKSIDFLVSSVNEDIVIEAENALINNPSHGSKVIINTINIDNNLELYGDITSNSISAKKIELYEDVTSTHVTASESIKLVEFSSTIVKVDSPIVEVNSTGNFEIKELVTDQLNLDINGYLNDSKIILPELKDIDTVNIELDDYSLDLTGNVNNLNITMEAYSNSAKLDCSKLVAKHVNAKLVNGNKAHVNVTEELTYTLYDSSELTYQGIDNINESSTKEENSTLTYLGE